jgi:hypothetical protein
MDQFDSKAGEIAAENRAFESEVKETLTEKGKPKNRGHQLFGQLDFRALCLR